jgi:hypothetical protein
MKAKKSRKQAPPPPVEITAEERYHLINDAAYFRSLQHQKDTKPAEDPAQSWCEVEEEIDGVLKEHHAKP